MARPARNEMAMKDFANHMKVVKANADLTATPKDIELWLFRDHNLRISEETIRKALRGDIDPTTCSVDLLVGLVAYFNVSPADLGRFAERRIATVLALAGTDPHETGPDGGSDLPNSRSSCTVVHPAQWVPAAASAGRAA